MSNGEVMYLAMVLFAFAVFIGVVGSVSIWSRIPRKSFDPDTSASAAAASPERISLKWLAERRTQKAA